MPQVLDLRRSDDPRDVIHRAVHLLAEGALVAFPTETVYLVGAHALQPAAVEKLRQLCHGSMNGDSYSLCIKGAHEALDYVPRMGRMGRKLARRCWPGPLTIGFDVPRGEGLLEALPDATRDAVVRAGALRLRAPAHEAVCEVLRLMPAPVVVSAEVLDGLPAMSTAQQVANQFGEAVSLIVDDGSSRYGEPASIVHVDDDDWQLVRTGVVTERMLRRLASEVYIFVCTGNTCRSPMSEAIFRKLLADRLRCPEDDLADRGFIVASAGLAAVSGAPAAAEAVEVLARRGLDLGAHASQPVTERLLDQADHIYAMTHGHRDAILSARPDLADRVELLGRGGTEIPDPIGGGIADYEVCEKELERNIRAIIEEIPIPS